MGGRRGSAGACVCVRVCGIRVCVLRVRVRVGASQDAGSVGHSALRCHAADRCKGRAVVCHAADRAAVAVVITSPPAATRPEPEWLGTRRPVARDLRGSRATSAPARAGGPAPRQLRSPSVDNGTYDDGPYVQSPRVTGGLLDGDWQTEVAAKLWRTHCARRLARATRTVGGQAHSWCAAARLRTG